MWTLRERGGVRGGWRSLINGEVHILYSSANIIRINKIKGCEMNRTRSTHQQKIN
jgi:hypothetical protein